ncbi:hypothetical protein EJB05_03395, partial [Eragrostis curvula]
MPPRKRRRTCCEKATTSSPDTPLALPVDLLVEIAARTEAITIFRCAATCKLFRREILNPSFTARVVCRDGVVPGSSLLGLLDKTFSLVHPSPVTSNAASSFGENDSLAAFVSRSAGGGLLEEYKPVTSRGGLVLLKRREIIRRLWSKRRSDLCVYDPMTNRRAFFPFPPDIDHRYNSLIRYVVLTAADGIGCCSFMVVAVDMDAIGNHECNPIIDVQTLSSSSDAAGCQWSPVNSPTFEGLTWSRPVDGQDAAVVIDGVIHWVMESWEHILTYDVRTGRTGLIALPIDDGMAWRSRLRLSSDGNLTLLCISGFRVLVWELLRRQGGGWARQATIDTEASVRSLLSDIVELKSENLRFKNFGDQRSGAVLLQYLVDDDHRELLVLDMETKEICRIVGKTNATGVPYEVDLASRLSMADGEDIQPLVCDNGTGMVKIRCLFLSHFIVF